MYGTYLVLYYWCTLWILVGESFQTGCRLVIQNERTNERKTNEFMNQSIDQWFGSRQHAPAWEFLPLSLSLCLHACTPVVRFLPHHHRDLVARKKAPTVWMLITVCC
mmetsp:Transcript_4509/g.10944  ORF Transcript_4509/g.10944 Transcript_4509/m.10944 type:complete len:107 (-) Transcript_4509:133-453(-)